MLPPFLQSLSLSRISTPVLHAEEGGRIKVSIARSRIVNQEIWDYVGQIWTKSSWIYWSEDTAQGLYMGILVIC